MTVYVDELMNCPPTKKWPYKKSCHMRADTEDELHAFAAKLGLKRKWYQDKHKNPKLHHYDLNEGMRWKAVRLGAQPITWREMAEKILSKGEQACEQEAKSTNP